MNSVGFSNVLLDEKHTYSVLRKVIDMWSSVSYLSKMALLIWPTNSYAILLMHLPLVESLESKNQDINVYMV